MEKWAELLKSWIRKFEFFCQPVGGKMTSFDILKNFVQIYTAQKMKFSIKDFFSKCDQMCSFLRIYMVSRI